MMNILTSETAQQIYGTILMIVAISAIIYTTVQAWKNYNKPYIHYENTFCEENHEFTSYKVVA